MHLVSIKSLYLLVVFYRLNHISKKQIVNKLVEICYAAVEIKLKNGEIYVFYFNKL